MVGWKDWLHLLSPIKEDFVKTSARANRAKNSTPTSQQAAEGVVYWRCQLFCGVGKPRRPKDAKLTGEDAG